jgi:transcriptional regulator with XRE-family HTH domain
MKNRLKHHRVSNAKTQTEAAKAAGVTQPTYQRWEAGHVEVPEAALKKLAKLFKATPAELLGRHPPKEAAFYDDKAPLDLQYYGEVAVHFKSGSEPLVLSISEAAHAAAYSQLQSNRQFITFKDLSNRSVAIRREAISEFYFSSEAHDWYGPEEEHEHYKLATPIQMPDPRDWEIVEAFWTDDIGGGGEFGGFAGEDVKRVESMIMISDEQFDEYVAKGVIKPEDLATEKAARAADTEDIFALCHTVRIQLTSGKRREIGYVDSNLFECWEQFEDEDYPYSGREDREGLIRLPVYGYHHTIFFNPEDIDYVSLPTYKMEEDRTESYSEHLTEPKDDGDGDGDAKVIRLAKGKKEGGAK